MGLVKKIFREGGRVAHQVERVVIRPVVHNPLPVAAALIAPQVAGALAAAGATAQTAAVVAPAVAAAAVTVVQGQDPVKAVTSSLLQSVAGPIAGPTLHAAIQGDHVERALVGAVAGSIIPEVPIPAVDAAARATVVAVVNKHPDPIMVGLQAGIHVVAADMVTSALAEVKQAEFKESTLAGTALAETALAGTVDEQTEFKHTARQNTDMHLIPPHQRRLNETKNEYEPFWAPPYEENDARQDHMLFLQRDWDMHLLPSTKIPSAVVMHISSSECDIAQRRADLLCERAGSDLVEKCPGGDAIVQGMVCLQAVKEAERVCSKPEEQE